MIKAIHFADLHIGVDTYGPKDPETRINGRVLDYLDMLDALIDYAEDNGCDVVLFAGDAFHKPNPDTLYMREFARRIIRLRDICDVVLLVGNHDLPGHAYKSSSLELFETLQVDGVVVGNDYEVIEIDVGDETLYVATVPYPAKGRLADPIEIRGLSPDSIGALVGDKLSEIIENLGGAIKPGDPCVLLGHFTVDAAQYGSERYVETVSAEPVVPLQSLTEGPWDYVALGHLHMHQDLGAKTGMPVVYAGSLERVDFSEEKHDKGFVWIEFDHGDVRWEFIEIDARPYKTLYVDVSGIERGLTQNILKQVRKKDWTDAVARIVVTVNETDQHKIYRQDIEEALIKAGAYYVHSVSLDVIREGREVRLDANKPIQSYTEEELLETYFLGTGMKPGKKLDRLINMAFDIMDEVDSGK